jgi:hypothetical protein
MMSVKHHWQVVQNSLTTIPLPFEVEIEVQNATLKSAFEALLVGILPLFVDDAESNVLIWRACLYTQNTRVSVLICLRVLLQAAHTYLPFRAREKVH